MIIFVDMRTQVRDAFASAFARQGLVMSGLAPLEFRSWMTSLTMAERNATEGVLLGDDPARPQLAVAARQRLAAPVIALLDVGTLDQTLNLFDVGVDDVVRKPVHVRELMARYHAIGRRADTSPNDVNSETDIRVFGDGRDPEVGGHVFPLPRRERRILELLVAHRGRRISKTKMFDAVYGIFDTDVEANVIESHVSKLRKKLKARLGHDPIESKRFLGYCLQAPDVSGVPSAIRSGMVPTAFASA